MRNRFVCSGLVGVAATGLVSVQSHDPHASTCSVDRVNRQDVETRAQKANGVQ
jgi:hypothetical protein